MSQTKPTNVSELFDYLDAHPWLKCDFVPHNTFKARVDRNSRVVRHGKTLTYTLFHANEAVDDVETSFDALGFTVTTTIGRHYSTSRNVHRYLYVDGPEDECQQPTSTPASTAAGA